MTSRKNALAMLLSLLAPLGAAAQTADKPADKQEVPAAPAVPATDARAQEQAPAAPAAAAPAPAPAPAAPAAPAPKVTYDFGAWFILNSWWDSGALNAADLPRFATADDKEQATGMSIRQTRFRVGANVPGELGLLGDAALKAFVEVDFVGGYVSGDESAPLLRLRHGYVSANWKEHGNLTLLVGQTTDVFHGAVGAASLAHLAAPRFAGAGYLYRRTPQVRLSGELGKDVAVGWQLAALSSSDKSTQTAAGVSVGYRAFAPDLEGRIAFLLRGASKLKVELGVGGRYAQEKWVLAGLTGSPNKKVKSQGVASDLKVEYRWVTLVGGAFAGENLDVENATAPGVRTTNAPGTPSPGMDSVKSVPTKGAWGQLQLTPVKGLQLLAGAGVEVPTKRFLPATFSLGGVNVPSIDRNLQISGGAILNLTSKWRAGVEYTRYVTHGVDDHTSRSDQIEISTLLAL